MVAHRSGNFQLSWAAIQLLLVVDIVPVHSVNRESGDENGTVDFATIETMDLKGAPSNTTVFSLASRMAEAMDQEPNQKESTQCDFKNQQFFYLINYLNIGFGPIAAWTPSSYMGFGFSLYGKSGYCIGIDSKEKRLYWADCLFIFQNGGAWKCEDLPNGKIALKNLYWSKYIKGSGYGGFVDLSDSSEVDKTQWTVSSTPPVGAAKAEYALRWVKYTRVAAYTWSTAKQTCSANGGSLCSLKDYCAKVSYDGSAQPLNPDILNDPGDQTNSALERWAPYGNEINGWVKTSSKGHGSCTDHNWMWGPPAWGLVNASSMGLTMCCRFEPKLVYTPQWVTYKGVAAYTWSKAKETCDARGGFLCSLQDYCAKVSTDGKAEPINPAIMNDPGDQTNDTFDRWAPYSNEFNGWVRTSSKGRGSCADFNWFWGPPAWGLVDASSVGLTMCCRLPPQACDEKLERGASQNYRGCQTRTRTGKTCQFWNTKTPHAHDIQGPANGIGDHNFCRNPDGEPTIWCFTTDPNTRYDFCDPISRSFDVPSLN